MPTTCRIKSASPKYLEVASHIRRRIQTGKLCQGDRVATVAELCTQFGVSASSVDQAFFVLDQEGLIDRQNGRGIFVATTRRPLVKNLIGLQWSKGGDVDWSNFYSMNIINGMEAAAHRLGFEILLLDSRRVDYGSVVDGVVFADVTDDQCASIKRAHLPAVSVIIGHNNLPSVVPDDFGGTRLAVEHLVQLGHCRIACLMWGEETTIQRNRVEGYRAGLRDAGIEPEDTWVRQLRHQHGAVATQAMTSQLNFEAWLASDWFDLGCTAILCQNDEHARGVLIALAKAGLSVPGDVSVVGFDGTALGDQVTPRLTSVAVPLSKMGERATEMLIAQVGGDTPDAASIVLRTGLTIRESTGPAKRH